jgi:hypothetical protein
LFHQNGAGQQLMRLRRSAALALKNLLKRIERSEAVELLEPDR